MRSAQKNEGHRYGTLNEGTFHLHTECVRSLVAPKNSRTMTKMGTSFASACGKRFSGVSRWNVAIVKHIVPGRELEVNSLVILAFHVS